MNRVNVVCPSCGQSWNGAPSCERCGTSSRVPRFSLNLPVTYPDALNPDEWTQLEETERLWEGASTLDLVQRYYRKNRDGLEKWLDEHKRRHEVFADMLETRYTEVFGAPKRGLALEIGCGIGSGLLPLARRFEHVVGIEISAQATLVAKKMLAELRIENVTVMQASAHELPFSDQTFDYIKAVNVIEHVYRPDHFFEEVHRVLKPGGGFAGDSRNRFDPFFPEPHVHLMWVGYLPRRFMDSYVRLRTGKGYDGKYLLSEPQLRRAVTRSFGDKSAIVLPNLGPYVKNAPQMVHRGIEALHRRPLLERLTLPIFPTHVAVAQR